MILKLVVGTGHIQVQMVCHLDKNTVELVHRPRSDTNVLRGYSWIKKFPEVPVHVGQMYLTCRQLYFEVKYIFYSSNVFALDSAPAFSCWKRGLGKPLSNVIRRLVIKETLVDCVTAEELSTRWKGLQLVYLVFRCLDELPQNFPRNDAESSGWKAG